MDVDLTIIQPTKEHSTSTELVKYPKPICCRCNKEVDSMTIKDSGSFYKIEVECHRGYEMYRIEKSALMGLTSIEKGVAFKP